jgi:hypothetical protein
LTSDGTAVAFASDADDLVPADTDGQRDVFVRDLVAGTTTLVPSNDGTPADGASQSPSFSPDGTKVAFTSNASNLGPTDTNGTSDVYVYERSTGDAVLVSANESGTDAGNAGSWSLIDGPSFAPDGRVLFDSLAGDFGPHDANGTSDVYLRDLATGGTELVSVATSGADAMGESMGVTASGDRVVFDRYIGNRYGSGIRRAVHVRDLGAEVTTLASNEDGYSASATLGGQAISVDGRVVVFFSTASNVVADDGNGVGDVFVATFHAADLVLVGAAAPDPVVSGGQVTYRLQLTNAGPDPLSEATVGMLLADGTRLSTVESSGTACTRPSDPEDRVVACDFGDVDVGGVVTMTVTATVTAPPGSQLSALGIVLSPLADIDPDQNTVTINTAVSGS